MRLRKFLSHLIIILSGMFVTFLIVDRFNPGMRFIDNDISNVLLCAFSIASGALAILTLVLIRRYEKHRLNKE